MFMRLPPVRSLVFHRRDRRIKVTENEARCNRLADPAFSAASHGIRRAKVSAPALSISYPHAEYAAAQSTATTSISTSASLGSFATCTAERAG